MIASTRTATTTNGITRLVQPPNIAASGRRRVASCAPVIARATAASAMRIGYSQMPRNATGASTPTNAPPIAPPSDIVR